MLNFDLAPDEVESFLAETDEHLQRLDEDLVRLEREPDNLELLQEIFRSAHTLKGNAAYIGHHRMADLTHAMENLLDSLRKGTRHASPGVIDTLLSSLDLLHSLKTEVVTRQPTPVDIKPVAAKLRALADSADHSQPRDDGNRSTPVAPKIECREQAQIYLSQGLNVYEIVAHIAENSYAPAVRALQIILELSQIGQVFWSSPSEAEIEAQQVGYQVCVWLATPQPVEAIHAALGWLMDVTIVDVCALDPSREDAERRGRGDTEVQRRGDGGMQEPGDVAVGTREGTEVEADLTPSAPQRVTAPPAPSSASAPPQSAARRSVKTVRTSVERLDNLMNLVGELVTDRNRLFQLSGDLTKRYGDDLLTGRLYEATTHVGMITDQLQEEVMKARLVPIDEVFNKFPRLVRDLARKAGKEVELVIEGRETELDRSVSEEITDPLMHILRNAVDHGIEIPDERRAVGKPPKGLIRLSARHQEDHILITVEDDGRGIDLAHVKAVAVEKRFIQPEEADRLSDAAALELIFMSGLSTARRVSDVSGRGVGMDVVRANIKRLNGTIAVRTQLGQGTVFEIKLPLTLAIMPALLVALRDETYAVPLASVVETLRIRRDQLLTIRGREVILLRGQVLPILRLNEIFGVNGCELGHQLYVVSVKSGQVQAGLVVDGLVGQQEVVVKSLSSLLGELRSISGGTILGDGRVALIVDVGSLIEMVRQERREE